MSEPASSRVRCPYVVRLPVLGVETTFRTDSPEVMRAIRETYGAWEALRGHPEVVSRSGAVVRIVVAEGSRTEDHGAQGDGAERDAVGTGDEGPDGRIEVGRTIGPRRTTPPRVPDSTTLRIDSPGGSGVADVSRLESRAHVTPELAARRDEFVEGWLEPLTLFLLGSLDRQPLHAAAVVRRPRLPLARPALTGHQQFPRKEREGSAHRPPQRGQGSGHQQFPRKEHQGSRAGPVTALLLAGPSGVGKSTLTYAAWRRGFGVLADEPVYVQLRPRLRVWGRRARLHLPGGARAHFPELSDVPPIRLQTGKTKIVMDVGRQGLPFAERAGICLLSRGTGRRPRLEAIGADRVVDELLARLDPGYDLFADTIGERIARVAEGGAWSLTLAGGPEDAVPFLEEAARQVGGAP